MIENDPSARMQVRSMGELMHPASCCVCGNGTCDDGYLDLGVYYDYEGQMYLCMTCATQAGETIGMFTPEEFKIAQTAVNTLQAEKDKLLQELDYARPLVSAVLDAVSGFSGLSSDSTEDASPSAEPEFEDSDKSPKPAISGEPISEESVTFS